MPSKDPRSNRRLAAVWAILRERPLLTSLFAVLFVAQSVPLWVTDILPQGDLYQHLAIAEIIHNYDAPGSIYPDYFQLPDFIKPNLLYYYVVHVLAYIVPMDVANKLLLNAYVFLLPLSMLYLLTVFGRPRRLALFAFLFVFNSLFRTGYAGYLLSIPFYLFGIGMFYRWYIHPNWGRFAGVGLVASLLFCTHAQMYLLYMLTVGVMALFLGGGLRSFGRGLAAPCTSLVLFVPWFLRYFIFFQTDPGTLGFLGVEKGFGAFYHTPETLLARWFNYVLNYFRGSGDEVIALVLFLLMGVGLVLRGSRSSTPVVDGRDGKLPESWRHRYLPEIVTLLVAISVFALPVHIKNQAVISVRHITVFMILLIPWLGWFRDRRASAALGIAVAVLAVAQAAYVSYEFKRYEKELDGYEQLFDAAKPWGRLYKVSGNELFSRVAHGNVFWHIHYNYMTWHGGITDVQFAEFVTCPLRYRPGMVPPKLANQPSKSKEWRYYDYFLVQRPELHRMRGMERWLRSISENRGWVLFEKRNRPFVKWWDLDRLAPPKKKPPDRAAAKKPTPPAPTAAESKHPRAPRVADEEAAPRGKNTLKPLVRRRPAPVTRQRLRPPTPRR